jgi:hypothetical protein
MTDVISFVQEMESPITIFLLVIQTLDHFFTAKGSPNTLYLPESQELS